MFSTRWQADWLRDRPLAFVRQYAASPTAAILREIIKPIAALDRVNGGDESAVTDKRKEDKNMRIVIPLAEGKLTNHFGHCKRFALVDVDPETKVILRREDIEAPPHEPGLLPSWLAERGVTVVIAGGLGQRAQGLFAQQGIHVVTGALAKGTNACDH